MGIMNFFNKTDESQKPGGKRTINLGNFLDYFQGSWDGLSSGGELSEVTYYTCLKVLTESVGKLSLHMYDKDNKRIYNHEAVPVLCYEPNPYMNASGFKSLMEFWRVHFGNAYAYIKRDRSGNLLGVYPLNPLNVTILVDNAGILSNRGILYEYKDNLGKSYYFTAGEILHLRGGISKDGITGVSVRETLAETHLGAKASQKYLNNLYKNGLTAKAILRYTGDLSESNQEKLLSKIKKWLNMNQNNTGLMPLAPGLDVVPLDLKLTDAQFFELKKFNSLQIAAAYGVKPNHLNNYDKSSYSNSEMQNLTFYVDTLLYILTLYEEEFNRKLLSKADKEKGYHFKFNVAAILRGDLKTQSECLSKYVTSGIYTVNEARKRAGMTELAEGDVVVMNGSYVPLSDLGVAYKKEGKGGKE